MAGKKDFYDCNTDSGFLSSSNLNSESNLEMVEPEMEQQRQDSGKCVESCRLDSGVDVELTGPLSGLQLEDLSCTNLSATYSAPLLDQSFNDLSHPHSKDEQFPDQWELYYQQDEDGETQLHIAVIRGERETVRRLIRMAPASRFLDIRNDMRQTALHLAVLTSAPELIKPLVAGGAKTDSVDHHGNTPLHLAVAAGDMACVKQLTLSQPDSDGLSLRYKPAKRPSIPPELNMYNYEGLACVHIALMGHHISVLKHLVRHGADIDARECKSGLSAVHMAVESGKGDLVKLLVNELRADPCPLTFSGQSPYRLGRHHPALASLLESLGAAGLGDYSDSSDDEHLAAHSDEEDLSMYGSGFRNLQTNGGMVSSPA